MRALRDTVIVRERADLDPGITDIVIPDIAKQFNPSMSPDHLCYAEVVSVGPGSIEQPRLKLKLGDIVTFDLANVSHAFIEGGAGYQVLPQKAIVERRVIYNWDAGECRYEAMLDWVITVQDRDAHADRISSLVRAPDTILSDGQRTDQMKDGNMRLVYERVVSAGPGRLHRIRRLPEGDPQRLAYDDQRAPDRWVEHWDVPDVATGELIAFSPSASTRFRRDGKFYRATPWTELQFALENRADS